MKSLIKNPIRATLFATVLVTMTGIATAHADTLTLNVATTEDKGTVMAALFDSQAGFAARQPIAVGKSVATSGTTQVIFNKLLDGTTDLSKGTYGIAVFHDLNNNYQLEMSDRGIPTEPTGFSTDPRDLHRAPVFEDFKFDFNNDVQSLTVNLQTF